MMKPVSMLSVFFGCLVALSAQPARAALPQCEGYIRGATLFMTEAVPANLDRSQYPVQTMGDGTQSCDILLRKIIEGGDLSVPPFLTGGRIPTLSVEMKLFLHPEEEEVVLPAIFKAKNPGQFEIVKDYGLDRDGIEAVFVRVYNSTH